MQGTRAGPSLHPEVLSVLQRRVPQSRTLSRSGLLPTSPFLSCGVPLSRGVQPGPERGARTSCRHRSRRAWAAGTKTPLPAPAPSPAQSTGWVRGWEPCGELDLVRCAGLGHLGAASAMLVRAAPPSPRPHVAVFIRNRHQIGGQCPLGGARRLGHPPRPQIIWGQSAAFKPM